MSRDRIQGSARDRIAELAGRLMAQDHIDDFAMAKRKAARQLGLPDNKNLPGNQEVESALRRYRELYQPDHGDTVQSLRRLALSVMRRFNTFKPYLTGSVLSGLASAHSDINLVIYSDNPKALELFCLNEGIEYHHESPKAANHHHPVLAFEEDNVLVRIAIRPERDERLVARANQEPFDRAKITRLIELINNVQSPSGTPETILIR